MQLVSKLKKQQKSSNFGAPTKDAMSLSVVVVMRNGFFPIKLLLRKAIQIFLRKQLQLNLCNISNERNSGRDQETTMAYYRSKNNYYREPTCRVTRLQTIQAQKGQSACLVEGQQEKGRTINLVIRLLVMWGGHKKSHAGDSFAHAYKMYSARFV